LTIYGKYTLVLRLERLRYILLASLKLYLSIIRSKPFPLRLGNCGLKDTKRNEFESVAERMLYERLIVVRDQTNHPLPNTAFQSAAPPRKRSTHDNIL
jgi:hypothetical protein